jgi:periplasmic divalent cation tolerance protein
MTDKIIVLTTCDSGEEARNIARSLVEKRLAACVNLMPGMTSVYRWKGDLEEAAEYLLIIKSRRDLFERLRTELENMHSYEVPEAIALAIVDGSSAYLEWMDRELLDSSEPT